MTVYFLSSLQLARVYAQLHRFDDLRLRYSPLTSAGNLGCSLIAIQNLLLCYPLKLKGSLECVGWSMRRRQVGRYDSFSNQKAQQCSYCSNRLTTTARFQSGGFATNEIGDVLCTQHGPVRIAHLKPLDQPTCVANIIVAGVARHAMDAHQIIIETS